MLRCNGRGRVDQARLDVFQIFVRSRRRGEGQGSGVGPAGGYRVFADARGSHLAKTRDAVAVPRMWRNDSRRPARIRAY